MAAANAPLWGDFGSEGCIQRRDMATAYCIVFPNAAKINLHVVFKPPRSKIADIAQESVCLGSIPSTI